MSDRMGCGNHHERNRNAAFLMGKAVTVTVTKCLGINLSGIMIKFIDKTEFIRYSKKRCVSEAVVHETNRAER